MRMKTSPLYIPALILLLAALPSGGFSAWTWETGLRWSYFFLIACLASIILTPVSIFAAEKAGAIDMPDERRVHKSAIPRLGGLAIWIAFFLAMARSMDFSRETLGIMIGSSIIYLLGALDDIRRLSAFSRLFFQFLAAAVVFYFGLKITFTSGHGLLGETVSFAVTTVWLVGILNAFNFMDGIDGLAASMGLVCSMCFLVIGVNTGQFRVAVLSAAIAGACAGFLKYNWNPASVFLGDGGSTFIGFMLGCMAIYATWGDNRVLPAVSGPLLVLGIPVFDLAYTTVSRIKNGKVRNIRQWLEYAGRDHFHHRLISLGFDVRKAVAFIVLLNVILGLSAAQIVIDDRIFETFITIFQSALVFMLVVFLMLTARNRERIEDRLS
ncbi:MAG: MraY family glycosyltransferase [Elusimicrobiota bacterium]